MKTINEYIEQEYINEINMIEESIFDDEEEQLDKIEKDLEKSLNVVSRAENCKIDEWLTLWISTYMQEVGEGYVYYGNRYSVFDWGNRYSIRAKWDHFRRSELDRLLAFFKEKKCFTQIKYLKSSDKIEFKYNPAKDTYRSEYIKKDKDAQIAKIIAYKKEVENADTTKWAPDAANVVKMKGYYAKGSDPARIAKACGDDKLVKRFLIAIGMKWDKAVKEFRWEIKSRKLLTDAEIEAYENKYRDFQIN